MAEKHARAFDLPGWPCPPRVSDIPNHPDSWGLVPVTFEASRSGVATDELGFLWAGGGLVPRFARPNDENSNPGAVLAWTADGIGVWVHPKSMAYLPSISRLDMIPGAWIPIVSVLADNPAEARDLIGGA